MVKAAIKFSPLELCYQGEYLAAVEMAGLAVGEWPENRSGGDSEQAEALLVAGIILSTIGGIQQTGDQEPAREMLLAAIALDQSRSAEARHWIGYSYQWAGEFSEALVIAETVLAEASLTPRLRFRTLLLKVISCCHLDLLDQGVLALREMEGLYEEQDNLLKGKFHLQRGRVLTLQNETDRAITEYDFAIDFFHLSGSVRCEAVAAQNLSGIYCDADHIAEAHEYAERARMLFESLGDTTYLAKTLDLVAQIHLKEGKLSEARNVISEALQLIRFEGQALNECLETNDKIKRLMSTQDQDDHVTIPHPVKAVRSLSPQPSLDQPKERCAAPPMTPLENARYLMQNPDNAIPLYDLIVWIGSGRGDPQHDAEADQLEAEVFAMTPTGARLREEYRQSRLPHLVTSDS